MRMLKMMSMVMVMSYDGHFSISNSACRSALRSSRQLLIPFSVGAIRRVE